MRRAVLFSCVLSLAVARIVNAQELSESDVICTSASSQEVYAQHLTSGRVDLCHVPGTTIVIYVRQRVSPNTLNSGSMNAVLQGAAEADGRNRAEFIGLRQVLPRVWEVTHWDAEQTEFFIGELQLIWSENTDLTNRETRRNFLAWGFGAYRVFRCSSNPGREFPDNVVSCATFYRTDACDISPISPDGRPELDGYTVITVGARTQEDTFTMLNSYSMLHQVAVQQAQSLHLENCRLFFAE